MIKVAATFEMRMAGLISSSSHSCAGQSGKSLVPRLPLIAHNLPSHASWLSGLFGHRQGAEERCKESWNEGCYSNCVHNKNQRYQSSTKYKVITSYFVFFLEYNHLYLHRLCSPVKTSYVIADFSSEVST